MFTYFVEPPSDGSQPLQELESVAERAPRVVGVVPDLVLGPATKVERLSSVPGCARVMMTTLALVQVAAKARKTKATWLVPGAKSYPST